MDNLNVEKEIYSLFNTIYTMDLLLNKPIGKPIYKNNRAVIYNPNIIINFNVDTIQLRVFELKKDITNKLIIFEKFKSYQKNLMIQSYKLHGGYCINIQGILYEDVEVLKELILEIHKLL